MNESLLILGFGQYGQVVKELAEELGYQKIAFLDDENPRAVGKLNDFTNFKGEYKDAIVTIGIAKLRVDYMDKIRGHFQLVSLIHPKSHISRTAKIGEGCIIEPMVVIEANCTITSGCIIRAGSVIGHNANISVPCLVEPNSFVRDGSLNR